MSKEFEKALEESNFFIDFECDRDKILRKDSDGNYTMNRVRDYCYFWEASRKTVQLPDPRLDESYMNADDWDEGYDIGYNSALTEISFLLQQVEE